MLNILLTSVGRRSYLVKYFKEALVGRGMVHAANSSAVSPAFLMADKTVVTPLIYDSSYIDFLISYCKDNDIHVIISLFDVDLLVLAQHKQTFRDNGIQVIVSDEEVVSICNDKWSTYQFLIRNNFHAPLTFVSLDDAIIGLREKRVSFPLILKPRWGMGSIGVYEACNDEELCCLYKKIKRDIQNTYLKYESSKTPDCCVLIQEKIKGQEYGLDVINDLDGKYINTSVKMKYAMRSGETDCAVTKDNPKLKEIGERIGKALHHIANLDVDVFDVEGVPYVLEMNARFGGGYPFSHVAGVNLPLAIVNWILGIPNDADLLQPKAGIMAQKDINIIILQNVQEN